MPVQLDARADNERYLPPSQGGCAKDRPRLMARRSDTIRSGSGPGPGRSGTGSPGPRALPSLLVTQCTGMDR